MRANISSYLSNQQLYAKLYESIYEGDLDKMTAILNGWIAKDGSSNLYENLAELTNEPPINDVIKRCRAIHITVQLMGAFMEDEPWYHGAGWYYLQPGDEPIGPSETATTCWYDAYFANLLDQETK